MKLSVPYFSQFESISDPYWQERACGLVACYTLLAYFNRESLPSPLGFLKEALSAEAYSFKGDIPAGWVHDKLVALLCEYGLCSYRQEFRAKDKEMEESLREGALRKFEETLIAERPLIVSIYKNWTEKEKFHQVILVGFEKEGEIISGFYVHDPGAKNEEEGAYQWVPKNTFLGGFRGLSIFASLC